MESCVKHARIKLMDNQVNIDKKVLESILENVDVGVIVTDLNRKIIEYSKGMEELTGFGFTEAFEKNVGEILKLLKNDVRIEVDEYCPSEHLDVEGVVFRDSDITILDKSDKPHIIDIVVRKIRESEEGNIGAIILLKDKSKEAELERMKLDFISMSAHVLRTPITILRGFSQILLRENVISKLDENEIEAINQISHASDDLRDRVENMLAISSIKEGEIHINAVPLNIEGTVRASVNKFRNNAADKNLSLAFIPSETELPRAFAEVSKVQDIVEKLLDNAIRYTEEGSIRIWIEREENFLKIFIKDTGTGIPDEGKTQIFTKFYRVKARDLQMTDGNGLSLYGCKKIVEALGGEIGFKNNDDKGTTFYFTVPAFEEDLKSLNSII